MTFDDSQKRALGSCLLLVVLALGVVSSAKLVQQAWLVVLVAEAMLSILSLPLYLSLLSLLSQAGEKAFSRQAYNFNFK